VSFEPVTRHLRRHRPEQTAQRALFQHIRARGVAGLVAIHVPNGGFRSRVEAKIFAGLGVTAGAPDILLWHGGKAFALEIKSETGKLSKDQAAMLERLAKAGVTTAVCYGIDNAVATLEVWRLLRGAVQ
jgi:hypothetical protein